MSHGIQEFDRGCVWGTTWHRIPSYVTQDKPVSIEQAREVLDFPLNTPRPKGLGIPASQRTA